MSRTGARKPVTRRPRAARFLILAGLAALTGACHRGKAHAGGGVTPEEPRPLEVDFLLRTDLHLGTAFIGDVLYFDLDHDGTSDIAEGNFGTGFLTLAKGHAGGTFTTLHELPTRGHPFRLAAGDFDGDGLTDVAVADGDWIDGAQQAVEVFLQGPAPFQFGTSVVLDLDVDPKDLVAVPRGGVSGATGANELWVALRQSGAVVRLELRSGALVEAESLFTPARAPGAGPGQPFSLAAIDVGGDGLVDLVLGEDNPGLDRLILFRRLATGFQTPEILLETLMKPLVDATGDVDGNGYEDLAIAQVEADTAVLLLGDAAGLSTGRTLDFGGPTSSLLFEDLSGDGLPDAVATLFTQESVQVRLATAPVTFGPPTHYNVGRAPRAIGVLDLLGDGVPDLLCGNAQDLSILQGLGAGRFRGARGTAIGMVTPIGVESADLDNDGDLDVVVLTSEQQTLVFLENTGGELVRVNQIDLVPTKEEESGYFALADVDGDGLFDVVATVTETDELRLFRNGGTPATFRQAGTIDVTPVGDGPLGVGLGDLDEDGHVDAVVGLVLGFGLEVLRGTGAALGAPFESLGRQVLGFSPLDVHVADLDADGHLDVVLSARASKIPDAAHVVAILAGDGTGALELVALHDAPGQAARVALADLDADGLPDIVVGHFALADDEILVLRNRGGLAFEAGTLVTAPGPGTPLLADADQDGNIDLLVLSTGGELDLVLGDGAGRFLPRVRGADGCPDGAVAGILADLSGDRLPELIMVSPESPFVWVARNASFERIAP